MGEAEYPRTTVHKQQHKELIDQIISMLESHKSRELVMGEKINDNVKGLADNPHTWL